MQAISRTLLSSHLQDCLFLNRPFVMPPNTTLNELFGVQNGVVPTTTPTMGYLAIGNGGHKFTVGANNIPKNDPVQHVATDAALYNHLPFVLREVNNDLDPITAGSYALRRLETHNGLQYFAYYLKRLPLNTVVPDMEYNTVLNGVTTTTAYVYTSANLNPTPPALNSSGVNVVSGDTVAASAKMNIVFTPAEVQELINVATVMYQDPGFAIISELALCSGVDKTVQSPGVGNAVINFNEAIAVQTLGFINGFYPMASTTNGLSILIDIGSSEPMFTLI